MPISEILLDKVKEYVRAGEGDDPILLSLISAAKQYLYNAGVPEPTGPVVVPSNEDSGQEYTFPQEYGPLSLYELAVILYVNMLYNGGKETLLDKAMTAIILQIKQYNEEVTA